VFLLLEDSALFTLLHHVLSCADTAGVDLRPTQCPYDGALLDAEMTAGRRLLLVCCACDAVWETHGSHVGRVREPDRKKLIAARDGYDSPLLRKERVTALRPARGRSHHD
jgi:hypothetical protein